MPGDNCSVYNCGTLCREKGIQIFRLPNQKTAPYQEWCAAWLNKLKKNWEMDKDFRRQIAEDSVHTCEKHFHPHDIETCKLAVRFLADLSQRFTCR